eukprot:403332059
MKSTCQNTNKNCLSAKDFVTLRNSVRKEEPDFYDPEYKQKVVIVAAYGGLGYQMFRYAAAYSVARHINAQIWIYDPSDYEDLSTDRTFGPEERDVMMLDFFNIEYGRVINKEEHDYYLNDAVRLTDQNIIKPETFDHHQYFYIQDHFEYELFFTHLSKALKNKIYNPSKMHLAFIEEPDEEPQETVEDDPKLKKYKEKQKKNKDQKRGKKDASKKKENKKKKEVKWQDKDKEFEKEKMRELSKEILGDIDRNVMVHIRGGDFKNQTDKLLSNDYYQMALEKLSAKIPLNEMKLYVFTDDMEYAQELPFLAKYESVTNFVSDSSNQLCSIDEFYLMSLFKYQIISNSDFSWWAAFLNKVDGETVVAPLPKFGNGYFESNGDEDARNAKIAYHNKYSYPVPWWKINAFNVESTNQKSTSKDYNKKKQKKKVIVNDDL